MNPESTNKQMKIKDLQIWQKGIEIVDKIYALTDSFPKAELYGLSSQMKKASVSIPSNIAEGFARNHSKEYKQFLSIALGSCAELDTQLIIANRRDYIKKNDLEVLADQINHESRMISSLINKL
jgi:four helix bundle protein